MSAPLVVDARGLLCPLPLVKAARAFAGRPPGFIIELWSDDPSALTDVPEWCDARGHAVRSTESDAGVFRFRLERGAD
jgi:tRNA 2-thiouridine synthesizing protein A